MLVIIILILNFNCYFISLSLYLFLFFYLFISILVVILEDGLVKASGTYDALLTSGVNIDEFLVHATEAEIEELENERKETEIKLKESLKTAVRDAGGNFTSEKNLKIELEKSEIVKSNSIKSINETINNSLTNSMSKSNSINSLNNNLNNNLNSNFHSNNLLVKSGSLSASKLEKGVSFSKTVLEGEAEGQGQGQGEGDDGK